MHLGQTDLRRVGLGFAVLFLPGANLLCYGAFLANEFGGLRRTLSFTASAAEITVGWVKAWLT